jgi:hypothetical protein
VKANKGVLKHSVDILKVLILCYLGRPRRRWEDNIKMDLQEVGVGVMDWIELAQVRDRWRILVTAVMNYRVPYNAGILLPS